MSTRYPIRVLSARIAWYAGIACAIAFAPAWLVFGRPFWAAPGANEGAALGLAAIFLMAAAAAEGAALLRRSPATAAIAVGAIGLALLYLALLLLTELNLSRLGLLVGSGLVGAGIVLTIAPRRVMPWAAAVAVLGALGVGGVALQWTPSSSAPQTRPQQRQQVLEASQHLLSATYYSNYLPQSSLPRVYGGAIAAEPGSRRYVLARARGELYSLVWGNDDLHVEDLNLRVPINNADFEAGAPAGVATNSFRVADIAIAVRGGQTTLYASHHYWKQGEGCSVVRVSSTTLPSSASAPTREPWRTLFESRPCLPIKVSRGALFAGEQIGGNLEFIDDHTLLLTVGDHQFDGWYGQPNYVEDLSAQYGKTLVIDVETGDTAMFTMGHRNPQGLLVDEGRIWSTEHGPQGGDELNLLELGGHYGYPSQTYGTDYGTVHWPPGENTSEETAFRLPVFAWVPSIGISDLIVVRGDGFERWNGDLLVSSMAAKALWRVRFQDQHVVYAEPIDVGDRVRDLASNGSGEFVLWTDQETLVRVAPLKNLDEGSALFTVRCGGCHDDTQHRIGPNLGGVLERGVAGADGYNYTEALRRLGGQWTEDRLDAFLADPVGFAPGTTMAIEGMRDADARRRIVEYLKFYY